MSILLLAEVNEGKLATDTTAKAIAAASAIGDVTVLCLGSNTAEAAAQAARFEHVIKVLAADDAAFEHGLAEPATDLLASIAEGYSHIVAPATAFAKNLLPRLAALLDVMVISDVSAVIDAETFERPIYAGNAIQTVRSSDRIRIVSVRTASFEPVAQTGDAPVEALAVQASPAPTQWIEDRVVTSDRPELTSARIVVSGGRGLGSEENFEIVKTLADTLGAAVGASRAAVDSGYAPNDWQVGQTGKVVAPDLYIAVGISGAIQHLAGMKESKVIVAINSDPDAPIFQIADYGLVGDLFTLVPELTGKLK